MEEFCREDEMLPAVLSWAQAKGFDLRCEVQTPWGQCDLVGVKLRKAPLSERTKLRQKRSVGSALKFAILDRIPVENSKKSISVRSLENSLSTFATKTELSINLRKLIQNNFIIEVRKNHYRRLGNWTQLHSKIIAIELKLNRVTEVINQATLNKALTSDSFICLPLSNAKRVYSARFQEIERRGIGIIGVSRAGAKCLLRPTELKSELQIHTQQSVVERFCVAELKGN